ncbi:MAG TPA: J domain-containing protein [Blastocatellia bacterium]
MAPKDPSASFGNLSGVFFEIEQLLDRIERSTTHYQVLGIDRAASRDEVVNAYRRAVMLLSPVFNELKEFVNDGRHQRAKAALARAGEAYSNLFSQTRRLEYDSWLRRRTSDTGLPNVVGTAAPSRPQTGPQPTGRAEVIQVDHLSRAAAGSAIAYPDRRRLTRLKIRLPGRIISYDESGERYYVPLETLDVSRLGAALKTAAHLRIGNVVCVTMPMPIKLRTHGYVDHAYNIYAIIRRAEEMEANGRVLGVEFVGERPPAGYLQKPTAVFRLGRWSGPDRRREPRVKVAERVTIDYLDEFLKCVGNELAVTENVSASGARVLVRRAPPKFECIRVKSSKLNLEGIGVITDQYDASLGVERLCLRFKDLKWPVSDTGD